MSQAGFWARPAVLARLRQAFGGDAAGRAWLLVGPEGSGKEGTALEAARLANCPRPSACEGPPLCESCQKAVTFQHPDIRWFGPAPASLTEDEARAVLQAKRQDPFFQPPFAASAEITIGSPEDPGPFTVRALLRFLRLQPFQGRFKLAILAGAHRLTPEAANALLKTLEEPPPAALIFLLTSNRAALLPTIVSRCQLVRFDPYAEEELVALLIARGLDAEQAAALARTADGSVRKALALCEPAAAAVLAWAGDLIERIHAGGGAAAQVAAEMLHKGTAPAAADGPEALPPASDLAAKRERAMQLCEMLVLYYSELVSCRERGELWRPRAGRARSLAALAKQRSSRGLLADIQLIERAKRDIDRNLNIGLTMAVLLQGLIDNAQLDGAGAGR